MRLLTLGLSAFVCVAAVPALRAAEGDTDEPPVPPVEHQQPGVLKLPFAKPLAPESDRAKPFVWPAEEHITMTAGEVKIRKFDRTFTDAIVGASEIADVVPLSDQRIMVTAKKEGLTSILALDDQKNIVAAFRVEVTRTINAGRTDVVVHYLARGQGQSSEYKCDPGSVHVCAFIRYNKGVAKAGLGGDAQPPPSAQLSDQTTPPP